ncbi:hypothetical protein ACOMHN_061803 [Nucella lapillus]
MASSATETEVRQRLLPETETRDAENSQPSLAELPYSGKVFMARKKKPDSKYVIALEVLAVVGVIAFGLYCYYYFDNVHFHITHGYAYLGYAAAQHQVGQRYLHGAGVDKHTGKAMEWFRKAADQGHPHAAYNLAVGHLKGYETDLKPGESHRLIHHAAAKGMKEAHEVLNSICTRGHCV